MRFPNAVREHIRHNVVGYIALFCFAIGGTAIALPGKNKVDSGDIKPKAVHASDVAGGAITGPKLAGRAVSGPKIAPGAVSSSSVLDDSLTGRDIDEATLSHPIPAGAVGPLEEADRQRRIVVPAGAFFEGTAVLASAGPHAALKFDPATGQAAYLSTEVPGGRVEGTPLEVRLIWSSEETGGDVVWEVASMAVAVGESTAGKIDNLRETDGTTGDNLTATSFTLPGDQIQSSDLLALRIFRNGDNLEDTLPDYAQLFVVEISYTSTG